MIAIVAYDDNRLIGNSQTNKIPWYIPEDLKLFKEITSGHNVIMGRNTWESIPEWFRPLSNRRNIIVTQKNIMRLANEIPLHDDIYICDTLTQAEHCCKEDCETFVIGGASLYNFALHNKYINKIIVSKIPGTHEGDLYFPELSSNWIETKVKDFSNFSLWEINYHE
jgi:dihydrofolate reductase